MRQRSPAPSHEWAGLYFVLIGVITVGALGLRLARLDGRPMHTDEAVHADKFRKLLEEGRYAYDPNEFHGPTLNYFTLIPARLESAAKYTQITEFTLRIVPVTFGVATILATVLVVKGLGGTAAVLAALLAALSPAFVFYNRYYIQESLLVCFTFGAVACGYRYVRHRTMAWALLTGAFVGLMHATKETCIIAFGAMGCALAPLLFMRRWQGETVRGLVRGLRARDIVLGVLAAILVSALLYSSFLTNLGGVLDSYRTYATYFGRAGGGDTVHVHPWHYYLRMLLFWQYADGPIWTEAWIVLLGLVGVVVALRGKSGGLFDVALLRFVAFYTLAMTVIYCAIPYKTPWCMLGFLHGLILLAGAGAAALWRAARRPAPRLALGLLLVVGAAHLAFQAYRACFVYAADSHNPYVYGHPTPEILTAVEKARDYAAVFEDPCDLMVQVACTGHDYWPLPWYFRFYRGGFSTALPEEVGPLIFISEDLEGALTHKLCVETPPEDRQMYLYVFDKPYYIWARPRVKLYGFVRKDLWDRYNLQPDPAELLETDRDERQQEAPDLVRP